MFTVLDIDVCFIRVYLYLVSIRKFHNFPKETGRGFPEMNDTAFKQVLFTAEYAGIAGHFDLSE